MIDRSPFNVPSDESTSGGNFVSLVPIILWQRKWWIIICAALGSVLAIVAVLFIPPIYRSNAILLVESSQLPEDVINLSPDNVIERRLAAILQQITARPDLVELIDRHGLYTEERQSGSLSDVIDEMRSSISLVPTQSSLSSTPDQSTAIAFELAFEYSEPVAAQAVAQDLMDRVLRLDAQGNSEQAENTVQFLGDQAMVLQTQISELQSQIGEINARNGSVLAGNVAFVNSSAGSYEVQIASLLRDNQSLLQQRELALSGDDRDPVVRAAEQRLAAARAIYSETHPDVVFAKQGLEEARQLASANVARLPVDAIDNQIAFNNSQIAGLRSAKAQEEGRVSSQLNTQARAPLVRQQLDELQERLASVNGQYQRIQDQLMAARAGVRAEDERMAERLSVIDPPVIPEEPSWPDRLLLAALGVGGGLGLGLVLAFAVELFLRPIRDPAALSAIANAGPLGLIPLIGPQRKPSPWWRRRRQTQGTAQLGGD